MGFRKRPQDSTESALFTLVDADANVFNLKCLAVLCFLVLVCDILNEIGVFKVSMSVMRLSTMLSFLIFLMPILIAMHFDNVVKVSPRLIERSWYKILIIVCSYIGISIICITLSFHTVLLLSIPPLIAAQYRDQRKVFTWTLISTILLVPVGVYGSFFLGAPDRNFLKGMLTDEQAMVFANRLTLVTPHRMLELVYHYVIPRLFCVIIISILSSGISRRNGVMLNKQVELTKQVREEMERRNSLQTRVIDDLSALIETRDVGTGEHVIRTKEYVRMIAKEMQKNPDYKDVLTDPVIDEIVSAAPLHDVGKIAISDMILLKPGKLTKEEFEEMKKHTVKGGDMVQNIFSNLEDQSFLKTAKDIAVSHHERWDGTGYPAGLKGEEIPLSARIMAVADVFDALVSKRAYKDPISPECAFEILEDETGSHFDPSIMQAVFSIKDKFIRYSRTPIGR